jgi:phosphate transport system permease protein
VAGTAGAGDRRRGAGDRAFWAACFLGLVCIVAPAVSVLVSVVHQALPAIGWSLFVQRTNGIGIENAVLGTMLLLVGVLVVAGSIGVAAGVYLAEFASGRAEQVLRFFSEVLAGTPSIVVGYVGYVTLVVEFRWGFSLLAAIIALSVLVMPYIVKTTEVALHQIPTTLRESASALGMPRSAALGRVVIPTALPAIVSGLIVALAISTGELAPLLFTAGATDNNPSLQPFHHSVPYLTNVVFTDLTLPGARPHATAAAAGTVSLILLIALIAAGRLVASRARRNNARMAL